MRWNKYLATMLAVPLVMAQTLLRGTSISSEYRWETRDTKMYLNNQEVNLRGISWFGFETQDFVVNGLWSHPIQWYMHTLQQVGVNAIRIPFSAEWIAFNYDLYPYYGIIGADPSLQHKKSIEILDELVEQAKQHGIVILFDLHRLHKEYISELWYSPTDKMFTTDIFFETWFRLLDRYQDQPHILGIDLLNEPHGQATFGSGNPSTDWKLFVEYALPQFQERYPNNQWLFFIEGIEWGHTFKHYSPFNLPDTIVNRIVFSPHVYGKSVVPSTPSDPNQLHQNWNYDYGFLVYQYGKTVVPGEWGGQTYLDADWMNIFIDYLLQQGIKNNFLWSLGPNSGDVAGLLLDNWTDLDNFKTSLIQRAVPNPTQFSF